MPIEAANRLNLPILYIVIPCYNEAEVLPITAPLFLGELQGLIARGVVGNDSRILFVNDGSKDQTWQIIRELSDAEKYYEGISLSRNRGHQNALLAGLMEARSLCDITISMDCDGQDDITVIRRMVDAYLEGNDVVYGVRSKRETDTAFKRFTAESYYRLLASMGVEVVFNHADCRLMSRRALDSLAEFGEVNLYLRGMVPLVGFPSATVTYERNERMAGSGHYPLGKMLGLAIDGITSLSMKPLRIVSGIGIALSALGLIGVIWAIANAFMGTSVAGWSSIICIVCFIGGIQTLCLGVIGEYVGKIYLETKRRPRFIVQDRTWAPEASLHPEDNIEE